MYYKSVHIVNEKICTLIHILFIISDTSTILVITLIAGILQSDVLAMYSSIVQSMVVVQVLRTDERSHQSYELTTIYVLLDLNNVFINRLCAFDILSCGLFALEFRLVNRWNGLSCSGTGQLYLLFYFFIEMEFCYTRLDFDS